MPSLSRRPLVPVALATVLAVAVAVLALAVLAVGGLAVGGLAPWGLGAAGADRTGPTAVDVQSVSYPQPEVAGDIPPPARLAAVPPLGTVTLAPGPFSDRLRLDAARLGSGPTVRGSLVVTSDVSELLALEVTAAFYDAAGGLVGTGRQVLDVAPHSDAEHGAQEGYALRTEGEPVPLEVPAPAGVEAASAVLGVPVLVTE